MTLENYLALKNIVKTLKEELPKVKEAVKLAAELVEAKKKQR